MANTNKQKFTVVFVLLALLTAAVIGMVIALNNSITTTTLKTGDYKNGGLDDEGKYVETDESIVTKDYVSVDGLEIDVADELEITYSIYFYNEDKELVSVSENLAEDYAYVEAENVEYFKIVITPTDDEEVSLFEKGGYAKQLTVTVDR